MLDGISLDWSLVTPAGLVTIFVLMIATGRLHTNNAYKVLAKALEIERKSNNKLLETNGIQARTIEKQTVFGELSSMTMKAVKDEYEETGGSK